MSRAGLFISFEGGEGGGKSTQISRLAAGLRAAGHDVVTTREPGGSPGAEEIRELLVTGAPGRWDARTEALLVFAARRDHVETVIKPALARGATVLCDRFADSSVAYQGIGHGLGIAYIEALWKLAIDDFRPNLTVILDLAPALGLARASGRGDDEDRYERMGDAFHHRLRQGYLDLAARDPQRCAVIDASGDVDAVAAAIAATVRDRLGVAV